MADGDTLESSLDQGLAAGWKPSENDKIVGKITGMTKGWSDYTSSYYPILVIHDEDKDEEISVHAFHMALQSRLIALKPVVGDRIGIKMGPKIPLKSNPRQSVQTYTVKVEGKSDTIDWDEMQNPRTSRLQPNAHASVSDVQDDSDLPF